MSLQLLISWYTSCSSYTESVEVLLLKTLAELNEPSLLPAECFMKAFLMSLFLVCIYAGDVFRDNIVLIIF